MWPYVWREMTRRKMRTALTVLSIFIGSALLVSVWGVIRSLEEGVKTIFEKSGSNMTAQSFIEPGPYKRVRLARHLGPIAMEAIDKLRRLPGVKGVAGQLHFWAWMPEAKAMTAVAGIVPEEASRIGPLSEDVEVVEGRLLQPGDEGKRVAVVDLHYADKWGLKVGDEFEVAGRKFKVVGVVKPMVLRAAEAEVYIPLDVAQKIAMEEQPSLVTMPVVNNILIQVADLSALPDLERKVREIVKEGAKKAGVPPKRVLVFTSSKIFEQATGISVLARKAVQAIAIIVLVIMVLIVVRTALGSVAERTSEIGVLKAVGWKNSQIAKLLTLELLVQGVIGGVLGCVLGELVVYSWTKAVIARIPHAMNPFPCIPAIPMPTTLRIPFVASPDLVALAMGVSVVVTALSGLLAASKAAKLEPIEAFRRV